MAVGDQLLNPEAGWRRYDQTAPQIQYQGSWSTSSLSTDWEGTSHFTTSAGSKFMFSFFGTKLRLLARTNSAYSMNIKITIDGQEEVFSEYGASMISLIVVYEKLNLSQGVHTVVVENTETRYLLLDAIDIDDDGKLLRFNEVISVKDLDIGKLIRCHYSAGENTVGVFSNLGEETSDLIPSTSTKTPDGDFYLICVDRDYLGRWVLVADRNIQHSISWDKLNEAGYVFGNEIVINGTNPVTVTVRLMTGGVHPSDKDNEWDKYIVAFDAGGAISPGDQSVWNWRDLYSWTSTTTSSSSRSIRGYYNAYTNSDSTTGTIFNMGFRPVFLITPEKDKVLFFDGNEYKTFTGGEWVVVGTELSNQLFLNHGMDVEDLPTLFEGSSDESLTPIDNLVDEEPTLLVWTPNEKVTRKTATLTVTPKPKVILPNDDINLAGVEKIEYFELSTEESNGGIVRVAVSVDKGSTWKAFRGGSWVSVNVHDLDDFKKSGMTAQELRGVSKDEWFELIPIPETIRFAYYLELETSSSKAGTDKLESVVNLFGRWRGQVLGVNYDYEFVSNSVMRVYLYADGSYKINY